MTRRWMGRGARARLRSQSKKNLVVALVLLVGVVAFGAYGIARLTVDLPRGEPYLQQPALRWAVHGLYAVGWLIVVGSTFSLNHFDLFGLRQVWLAFTGQPYRPLPFRVPGPYRFVRHPLYVGWLMVFWSTPTMTATHLFFAAGMTAYILIAIPIEERDLLAHHGSLYREYQQRVGRLVPRPNRSAASSQVGNSKAEESACSVARRSIPPTKPNSASTLIPLEWAMSTVAFVC